MVVGWDVFGTPLRLVFLSEILMDSCYDSLFLGENESPCAPSLLLLLFVFRPRLDTTVVCISLSPSLYLSLSLSTTHRGFWLLLLVLVLVLLLWCCCCCCCCCCCFFVSWRVLIRFLFPSLSMLTTNSHVCSPLLMFLMSRIPSTRFQSQNELSGANLQRRGIWRCGRQMRSSIDAGVVDVCVQRSICSALDEFTPVHRWEENRGAPRALVYVTFDL